MYFSHRYSFYMLLNKYINNVLVNFPQVSDEVHNSFEHCYNLSTMFVQDQDNLSFSGPMQFLFVACAMFITSVYYLSSL